MRHCTRLRSVLAAAVLLALAAGGCAPASAVEVVQDVEVHRVMGRLCALAIVVNLCQAESGRAELPATARIKGCFEDAGSEWLDSVQVVAAGQAWWVGVPVDRYSGARRFLRTEAPELGVMEAPGGSPWLGGPMAWLRAASVVPEGKGFVTRALPLSAAVGAGEDADRLFLSPDGERWWMSPDLREDRRPSVLNRWGVRPAPELHAPAAAAGSSEEFRASPVGLPEEMHVGSARSDDLSIGAGDVIFNPIPRVRSE